MSAEEDLDQFEAEVELELYREYRAVFSMFRYVVETERRVAEAKAGDEGKPEAALAKIGEGRINGFFKDVALLEQPYAKDDKQSVKQFIGSASIVRFAQVEIG